MQYKICSDGIFKSIQGEGAHVGKSAVFVRFADCNMVPRCPFCDESFDDYKIMTEKEITGVLKEYEPFSMVVITGGEATCQKDLDGLVEALHDKGYFVALETNGLNPIPSAFDWITCSPKKEYIHKDISHVNEFKFVVSDEEDAVVDTVFSIADKVSHDNIYLQPESNSEKYINVALGIIDKYPQTRLSLQVHKIINVK